MWPDQVTVATVWKYSTNLSRGLDQQGQPRASRNEALAAKHHPYSSTVLAATIDSEKKILTIFLHPCCAAMTSVLTASEVMDVS